MKKVEESDLKNLEVIFALARQASVNSEEQLENIIMFKKDLFKRLKDESCCKEAEEVKECKPEEVKSN